MSGAEDLARLTVTIDTANELLLSDQIKMMDVGGGVMRPTNAKAIADLAAQMNGALIYTSVALGLAGTLSGGYFSVINPLATEYLTLYRNDSGSPAKIKDYPSSEAVSTARATADAAYGLSQPRMISDEMAWAVVDEKGQPILGVKQNGIAHAVLDKMPGLDMLSEFAWAVVDADSIVLLGIKWTGELVVYGQAAAAVSAYVDGPIGGQDVFALIGGIPYQVTSSGSNFSPVVGSGQVTFIRRSGAVGAVTTPLPVAGSLASFVLEVLHIVCSGQSLGLGTGATVTTIQPPTANRLLTLQDGVRLTEVDGTLTPAMVAPFKPLVAKATEVPAVQLCAQLNRIRGLPATSALLTSFHGRGGYNIAQLSKGTLHYNNSMTAVSGAKAECDAKGLGYRVPFVDFIHGEADHDAVKGYYQGALLQLQSDYDADIRAATIQAAPIRILTDQTSNWTAYSVAESQVPLEQLEAALLYPDRVVCAGPKYWLATTSDGIHLPAVSSMRAGAQHARAAKAIIEGGSWLPTHCIAARRKGVVVTLEYHTPQGPLVIDKVNVSDPGMLGIRWIDSTNSASVTAVRLIGHNKLEVTLSAVPTGSNPRLGVADTGVAGNAGGPLTGPRACLRDSSSDVDGYGNPLYNWACHQQIPVTNEV